MGGHDNAWDVMRWLDWTCRVVVPGIAEEVGEAKLGDLLRRSTYMRHPTQWGEMRHNLRELLTPLAASAGKLSPEDERVASARFRLVRDASYIMGMDFSHASIWTVVLVRDHAAECARWLVQNRHLSLHAVEVNLVAHGWSGTIDQLESTRRAIWREAA